MYFFAFIFTASVGHATLPVAEEHWLPLRRGGVPVGDAPEADVDDQLDIVGDDEHPAGFWSIDAENLYVRFRLASSPEPATLEGGLSGSDVEDGWGILINQDENYTDYEILASVDENGTAVRVETDPGAPGWTASPTASIETFLAPLALEMFVTGPADSSIGGSSNHFLDIRFPRAVVGLTDDSDVVHIALVTDKLRFTRGFEYDIAAAAESPPLEDALSDGIGLDADFDGLTVEMERSAETDPTRMDTDGDTYSDGDEVLVYGTNPLDPGDPDRRLDNDCDDIPDAIDFDGVDLALDPDDDGLTSEEELECGSDPCLTDTDIDGDGVDNADEARCGGDPCVAEVDIDGDGIPSTEERLVGTDPCVPDSARDTGVPTDTGLSADTGDASDTSDAGDTADTMDSGDSTDLDSDGGEHSSGEEDVDCDGIIDNDDENVGFDDDADNDGDGISNGLEIDQCGTDPCTYNADPDQDRVSNARENTCGTNPCNPDTDADGIWDARELTLEDCGPDSDGDGIIDALDPASSDAQNPVLPESGGHGFVGGNFTGGSCSHASGGASLHWFLVGFVLLFRRRPNAALVYTALLIPAVANAQSFDASVDSPGTSSQNFIGLRDPVFGSAAPTASLFVQHARDPLIYRVDDPNRDDIRVLGNLWSVHAASGYNFGKWDLSLQLPLHVYAQGDAFESWGNMGDVSFHGGITMVPRSPTTLGVGFSGALHAPTGNETNWLGGKGLGGTTALDLSVGDAIVLATSVGAHFEPKQNLGDIQTGTELRWRTGFATSTDPSVGTAFELMGTHQAHSFDELGANSVEFLASGRCTISERWTISAGGGTPIVRGIGAPALRLVAGMRYGHIEPSTSSPVQREIEPTTVANLSLSVTDHEGKPVQTRAVLVEVARALDTDASGTATADLPPARHTLRINQPGFAPIQRILDLNTAKPINLAVVLSPSRVEVNENQIVIQDRIFFETGSATLETASFALLDEVAMVMLDDATLLRVEVQGHTDDVGNEADNLRLSQHRAESVRTYLVDAGVDASRLVATGYGETRPLSQETDQAARMRNRRVEFHVVKRGLPDG